jgi:hypothetical protein
MTLRGASMRALGDEPGALVLVPDKSARDLQIKLRLNQM